MILLPISMFVMAVSRMVTLMHVCSVIVSSIQRPYLPIEPSKTISSQFHVHPVAENYLKSEYLVSVKLPMTVVRISYDAFIGCHSLTSVELSCNLAHIGESAFYGCSSLRRISIPSKVCNIGARAFGECTSLRCFQFEAASISEKNEVLHANDFNEADVPVLHIGKYAFKDCSSLLLIDLPSHANLDETLFCHCNLWKGCQDDTNKVINRNTNRFKDLPLHRECYSTNVSVDKIKKILQKNPDSIRTLDSYGMTPLDVLVCNLYMSAEMIQCLVSAYPDLSKEVVDDKTTLELFLHCNGSMILNQEIDTMCCSCEGDVDAYDEDAYDEEGTPCSCNQCILARDFGFGSAFLIATPIYPTTVVTLITKMENLITLKMKLTIMNAFAITMLLDSISYTIMIAQRRETNKITMAMMRKVYITKEVNFI